MGDPSNEPTEPQDPPALIRIRKMLTTQRDLPATSYAPRRLAIAAANLDIRVQELTDLAIADPAIMIRLLRMSNSSSYRTRDLAEVVSLRRAIALLGHDQVRADVRKLPALTDRIPEKHQPMVRTELAQTIFATRLVRNLLDTRNPLVSDEGAITVTLARLINIVTAMVAPDEVCALRWVQQHHPHIAEGTSRELFGDTEEHLNREIISSWQLPYSVVATLGRATQKPRAVEHARDWLPLAVGLALQVAATTRIGTRAQRDQALMDIVQRYARSVDIDGPRLDSLIEDSAKEAIQQERSLGCPANELSVAPLLRALLKREARIEDWWAPMERVDLTGVITRLGNRIADPVLELAADSQAKPDDADQQLAKLNDEMQSVIASYSEVEADGGFAQSDETPWERITSRIAPQLLTGFRRVLRFDNATLFLRTRDDRSYKAVAASPVFSPYEQPIQATLTKADLFTAAMRNRVDLHIADCTTEKIQPRLPPWFLQRYNTTHGFVLLPLASDQSAPGFILATWNQVEPEGVTKAELEQLRRIRNALLEVLERFAPDAVNAD